MICNHNCVFQEKVSEKSQDLLIFNRYWDIQMFIHNPGEEFWLFWTSFPIEIVNSRLPVKTDDELSLIEIYLTETLTTKLSHQNSPCKPYTNDFSFKKIFKEQLWRILGANINCTVHLRFKRILFLHQQTYLNAIQRSWQQRRTWH